MRTACIIGPCLPISRCIPLTNIDLVVGKKLEILRVVRGNQVSPASFQSYVWKHFSFLVSRRLKAEKHLSNEKHSLSSECTFIDPLLMVNV